MPRVKDMKHRAIKPAIVVREDPETELAVWTIALAIASSRSSVQFRCSRYAFQRKME
jgi:hypothetical protein